MQKKVISYEAKKKQSTMFTDILNFNNHSVFTQTVFLCDSVIKLIESTGSLVVFLPPYSPNLNPIELAFAHVKAYLKANEVMIQAINEMVLMAFATLNMVNTAVVHYTGDLCH